MVTRDLYRTLKRYEIVGKFRQSAVAVLAALSADILMLFFLFSLDNILNFNSWIRIFFLSAVAVLNFALVFWLIWLFASRKTG